MKMSDSNKDNIKFDDPYPFCLTTQCVCACVNGCQNERCCHSRTVIVDGCCGPECLFICFPFSFVVDIITLVPFLAICGVKKCVKCVKSDATKVTVTNQPSANPVV